MKKIKTLTIDRRKWGRGVEGDGKLLHRADDEIDAGKMCCLGFYARVCGLTSRQIVDRAMPTGVSATAQKLLPDWLLLGTRMGKLPDVSFLAHINDDSTISDKVREKKITEIFAKHGIKVEFTH